MRNIGVIALLGLMSTPAWSGNLSYKAGTGLDTTGFSGYVAIFSAAYESPLWGLIDQKIEAGLWVDREGKGGQGSFYGGYAVGMKVHPGVVYGQFFLGVAGISNPDAYLSSVFQFTHDIGVGIEDKEGRALGLNVKHISNAGLKSPNVGRNFFMVDIKFPF